MKHCVKLRKKDIYFTLITVIFLVIIKTLLNLNYEKLTTANKLRFLELAESFNMSRIFDLEFKYVINNECITNSSVKAILIVTSYAGKFDARSALRRAYPQQLLTQLGVYRVFLLAKLKLGVSQVTQNAIDHENKMFNDLVQGNFFEDYKNLTYKHIMGIGWAAMHCHAEYVIKMDDDIAVNMYSLLKLIELKNTTPYDLMGYTLSNMVVIRQKNNKWYVPYEDYSGYSYPSFLSGWCYVMKFNTTWKLLNALSSLQYFWIDDVFVTGMLGQSANLVYADISDYFVTDWRYIECCVRDRVDCGFIVAPCGINFNINIDFQRHSKKCHEEMCPKYDKGKTLKNTCIVKKKLPDLRNGTARVEQFQLS